MEKEFIKFGFIFDESKNEWYKGDWIARIINSEYEFFNNTHYFYTQSKEKAVQAAYEISKGLI